MSNLILKGKTSDLGGFSVSRAIPQVKKRSVGPFVFLDHMGPITVDDQSKLDVRPHPHIGLSTVTYLFSGRGYHRDSLGYKQIIVPGDINWMTAGKGIVHSERTPREDIESLEEVKLHGVQVWVALPVADEDCEPSFTHYPKEKFKKSKLGSLDYKLLIGNFNNETSPVKTYSSTLMVEIDSNECGREIIETNEDEVGIFLINGECTINGEKMEINDLIIVEDPKNIAIEFEENTKLVMIGGEVFREPRHIFWNFVSSSKEKIKAAAEKWKNQEMGKVPEENDFIPLPGEYII